MKNLYKVAVAALAAFFIAGHASAQNAGSVTAHAFVLGKGAGTTGYTSLLCGSAQLAVGQSAADPICKTITGDVTISAAGVTAIGAAKVTNSMLAGSIAASKLIGTDIATVGTITAGTWNGTTIAVANGGTGATSASGARTNLGVAIGSNVQAWDADLDAFALKTAPTGAVVGTSDTQTLTGKTFNCANNTCTIRLASDITGFGTGVAAALAVNVGSAGAPVVNGGALGTPSSGTATNLTGTASGLTAGDVANASVIAKVLTGYTSGAGTVAATDSILSAVQKLNGNIALKAPLASPALTGTPTAPTASAGDSSTKIATTKYVDDAVTGGVSGVASLNGQTGALKSYYAPQGRLTLQSAVPVMTATQGAKTTIYYTPYVGNMIPIYDGTNMVPTAFSELSVATTDTSKNPAAIGANKVNDWFVWNDSGTLRLSHGPDWTSDTARSTGTALTMVNGVLLNSVSITNGPAASRGTYVGTTRSDGSSQLNWILASQGTAGNLAVWNMYNRRRVVARVADSAATWTYSTGTARQSHGSGVNQVSFVSGVAEDSLSASYTQVIKLVAVAAAYTEIGIALDSVTVRTTSGAVQNPSATSAEFQASSAASIDPQLGYHYVAAMELGDGTNANTFFGQQYQSLVVEGVF